MMYQFLYQALFEYLQCFIASLFEVPKHAPPAMVSLEYIIDYSVSKYYCLQQAILFLHLEHAPVEN